MDRIKRKLRRHHDKTSPRTRSHKTKKQNFKLKFVFINLSKLQVHIKCKIFLAAAEKKADTRKKSELREKPKEKAEV